MINVVRPSVSWATAASSLILGVRVDARGRLVEHDDVGVAQPDSGERQQLRLAGREPGAACAELSMDAAVGQGAEPGVAQRRSDGVVGRRLVEQGDVVADRAAEQLDFLRDQRDSPAQLAERDLLDGHSAQQQRSAGGLDQAQHQSRHRGLAAAGATDDADRAAGGEATG